jgi:hypothetical protein
MFRNPGAHCAWCVSEVSRFRAKNDWAKNTGHLFAQSFFASSAFVRRSGLARQRGVENSGPATASVLFALHFSVTKFFGRKRATCVLKTIGPFFG